MIVIGLTGGSGTGKTTALHTLEEMGAAIIDCDAVYHALLESSRPMLNALAARFPQAVQNGRVLRPALAEIVFSDPDALADLDAITHAFIRQEVCRLLDDARIENRPVSAVDAAALIESGFNELCDCVVGVLAPRGMRIARIMARDSLTSQRAAARIDAQQPDSFYRENCDAILVNDCGSAAEFAEKCKKLFTSMLREENEMAFREITLTGDAYARGRQYGESCRREIAVSIRSYQEIFQKHNRLSWQRACAMAKDYLSAIQTAGPAYLEEMRGLADGAGVDFEEILALNVRTELLNSSADAPAECTALSLVAPATEGGRVIAAQNWDYMSGQRDAVVLVRIPAHDNCPDIFMLTEDGIIGGKGMNGAGIALTLNAVSGAKARPAEPLHIRMRRVLECRDFNGAYLAAACGPAASPAHLLITHRDGLSLSIELDPAGTDVILPNDGILTHTNHFIGPLHHTRYPRANNGSTYMRLQRANQLLTGRRNLTVQDVMALLRDHAGYPASICTHPAEGVSAFWAGATHFGLVMDLTDGVCYLAYGNPCQSQFKAYSITK